MTDRDEVCNHRDIVSLREHLEVQIRNLDRHMLDQRASAQMALEKAELTMTQRLDAMRADHVTHSEMEAKLVKIVAEVRPTQDYAQWVGGGLTVTGVIAGIVLALSALAVAFLKG